MRSSLLSGFGLGVGIGLAVLVPVLAVWCWRAWVRTLESSD